MKRLFGPNLATLALALILVGSSTAKADLTGTQGFADLNVPTANTGNILTATSFDIGAGNLFVTSQTATGIFVGMPMQSFGGASGISFPVPPNVLGASVSTSAFSITSLVFGTFTSDEVINAGSSTSGNRSSITEDILGHWTSGTFAGFGGAGQTSTASMFMTFTQTGGTGGAISDSATFGVPAAIVPEPNSMVMVLLGLGTTGAISLARRWFSGAVTRV